MGKGLNYLARRQDQWDLIGGVIVKLQMKKITTSTQKPLPEFPGIPLNRHGISKLLSEAVTPRTVLWINA